LERRLAVWFLLTLVWGTAATAFGFPALPLVGKQFAGIVWVAQATLGALALAFSTRRKITFPFIVWLPWLMWVILRCDFSYSISVQRTAMLWGAPLVGLCASAVIASEQELAWMLRSMRVIVLLILVLFSVTSLHFLPPGVGFFGSSYITLCLMAAVLAPHVMTGQRRDTVLWLCCVGMCAWSAFRGTIGTCIMTLPLTPARISLNKRLAALLCMGALGLAVFAVPQVRQKMLRNSGHDKLRELAWSPGDTYSSGRFFMWELYLQEAWNRPLIGHGGSSSYTFGMKANEWDHPHNELIRVFFDYGVVGLVLLGIPFLYTFRFALRWTRHAPSAFLRDAWASACGGFIAMAQLGLTDNVILYLSFFGCLLFGLIGGACGASARDDDLRPPAGHRRLPWLRTHLSAS
jgi:O-antigen ligase